MKQMENIFGGANWQNAQSPPSLSYVCGFCGNLVSSNSGYLLRRSNSSFWGAVYICTHCNTPTIRYPDGSVFPEAAFGSSVAYVPAELSALYEEARGCTSNSYYTAAVLICRKMLMNIAVSQGAREGLKFIEYVSYLSDKGFVPPNGKHWVDHIRKKGNEATHEIILMGQEDAKDLITFIEMLLRFIYEFPQMVPAPPVAP